MIREQDVPPQWKWKRLGEICEIIGGKPRPVGEEPYRNGKIPFVRMRDLGKYHLTSDLTEIESLLNPEFVEKNNFRIIRKGSILIPRSGSVALNHRAVLGVDACIVSHICALEIKDPNVSSMYLYHVLRQIDMRKIAKKTTGLDQITFEDLRKIRVPLPSLEIQVKIVAILEKADQLKQWRIESDALMDSYPSNLFLKMFGDPEKNPRQWNIIKIGDAIQYSQYGTSVKSNPNGSGYPIVGMSNITYDGHLDFSKYSRVELPKEDFEKLKLHEGDVIFNRTNSTELVGKTAYWNLDVDAVLASYLVKFRLKGNTNPIFFTYLMNTLFFKRLFSLRCKKAVNQSNVSPSLLKRFDMYLPPIELQNKFASIVKQVERMKPFQEESKRQIDNLFSSLMGKAFRGELKC